MAEKKTTAAASAGDNGGIMPLGAGGGMDYMTITCIDDSSMVVPGVTIKCANAWNSMTYSGQTNQYGMYSFTDDGSLGWVASVTAVPDGYEMPNPAQMSLSSTQPAITFTCPKKSSGGGGSIEGDINGVVGTITHINLNGEVYDLAASGGGLLFPVGITTERTYDNGWYYYATPLKSISAIFMVPKMTPGQSYNAVLPFAYSEVVGKEDAPPMDWVPKEVRFDELPFANINNDLFNRVVGCQGNADVIFTKVDNRTSRLYYDTCMGQFQRDTAFHNGSSFMLLIGEHEDIGECIYLCGNITSKIASGGVCGAC